MKALPANKTKIVCTIGPASDSQPVMERMLLSGMNVARLNFSHGDHARHGAVLARLRAIAAELGVPVAILQDLAGPKVRVGTFAGGWADLEPDRPFRMGECVQTDRTRRQVRVRMVTG